MPLEYSGISTGVLGVLEQMDRIKTLDEMRREHIRQVLRSTHGDLEEASRILGITVATLRRRLRDYGILIDNQREKPNAS